MKRLGVPIIVYTETCTASSDVHWYAGALTFSYRHFFEGFDTSYSDDEKWFRLDRGALSVLVNLSDEPQSFEVAADSAVLLQTDAVTGDDETITVPPESTAIVGPPLP